MNEGMWDNANAGVFRKARGLGSLVKQITDLCSPANELVHLVEILHLMSVVPCASQPQLNTVSTKRRQPGSSASTHASFSFDLTSMN
jgi:hypothetical protein